MAARAAADELFAPKVRDLFWDDAGHWIPSDYKVMYGGRGGLKSWGFARAAVILATQRRIRFACAREYQASIDESVHQTIETQIDDLGLHRYFRIGKQKIYSRAGSEFFFAGIKTDPAKFKSTEGIDVLWIEEGEKVSKPSWNIVAPTIRKHDSEIWCGFNPDLPTDETSQRFIERPIPGARILETSWRDNPWLGEKFHNERRWLEATDPDAAAHVYGGGYRKNSKSQILAGKWIVEAFQPGKDWNGPYQGADWGFSQDPTTLVRMWIHGRKLYIEHEAWQIGCETIDLPAFFDRCVPNARAHVTRADNARPETVSHMQRHGYPRMESVEKWSGSVEDGVTFLRQFEQIVIHPRCEHTQQEAVLYSYKVDKITGDVLADIVDKHNHCWDAVRYALQPMIRNPNTGFLVFAQQEVERMNERKQAEKEQMK